MSSKPRRLAVLAVATTLASAAGTAQAASAQTPTHTMPSAQWVVVSETAAIKPPASVTGLAQDLGVDTDFAWRMLDELARSGASAGRGVRPLRRTSVLESAARRRSCARALRVAATQGE
jgi:hypothetical protein